MGGNFYTDFNIIFGDNRANIQEGGTSMSLTMDQHSGSGMASKNEYLFGRFDMQIKLIPNNSAGTVTTLYLSSIGSHHDEIDLEFLGNLSGDPYILSTNLYANGIGGREMQFYLWFDPTEDFHTYSIDWNPQRIIILVDNIPIRVFHNKENIGVSFPTSQPMRVYTTLWDGDFWATRGGQVKIDWSKAPFVASFKNFNANACIAKLEASCKDFNGGRNKGLNAQIRKQLKDIHSKWVVYDYCRDFIRFAHGFPSECNKKS
ncbi:xyloglucan endotransglucosylase/hydrolase protein 15 [Cajanus cajan]|uniref:Xyloglucan endotransglucosylase/hydrolase n=1 Tax=Cajanus cajan TaxID=3821 RepID=A0A151S917_CAJCA|nr:xyloglucan endotransglucosylase/hydrolase protein 15 [Cajanus cajan]KYP51313.1 putative xyloglucan endotransglucosylase/hydrolase protein 15 [Cajanus cajan]